MENANSIQKIFFFHLSLFLIHLDICHFYRNLLFFASRKNRFVVWVLWHINLCMLFKAKSIFMKIVLFQTIPFSISTQFKCKYSLFLSQTVLIQIIQFSMNTDFVYTQINAITVLY